MTDWPLIKRISPFSKSPPRVALLRLSGSIGAGARSALSDEAIGPVIEKAFRKGKPAAVALLINSPGGSPVQSSLIAARIRRLAEEKNIPVHAFVEDVAASGGYWLACAADDIWADPASIVGSIGVISAGFGLPVFLARQGVERRVYTSGKSKSQLDPFQPEKKEDVDRIKALLEDMHTVFIDYVKSRRGDKLSNDGALFSGEFWLGARAAELGLVDGQAHVMTKLQELYGKDVRITRYGRKKGLFSRFGANIAEDAIGAVEDRASFARYGL
ncbi:S49 family peptidase [Pseudohalocynthiibacter aestuariivivens]|nr:S49 family peptidase [Pseudohalocynthiibacter aestuariivivens]QIE45655.1 S49 family peptidase [Pseudohalocynthiibacter aestuariivivens]